MKGKAGRIPRGVDPITAAAHLVVGGAFLLLVTLPPTIATSQEANADQSPTTSQDVFKPPQNLFQLRYQYRTAPGSGSTPGSIATVTTDQIRLRLDHRIDLSQQSLLVLRGDLRVVAKEPDHFQQP